jgi:hypothetical protein
MKTKILMMMIAALLTISLVQAATTSTTGDPTIGFKELRITYLNQDPDPVEPGNTVDVRFKIENVGEKAIKNLKVELIPAFPLSFEQGEAPVQIIGNIDPYIQEERGIVVRWKLRTSPDAAEGDVDIKIRYTTNDGQSYTQLPDITVHVESVEKILSVEKVTIEPQSVRPGQQAKITFALKNLADSYLQNVKINLDLTDVPFGVLDSSTQKVNERIPNKANTKAEFTRVPNNDAELKVYNIPFTLTYMDSSGGTYEIDSKFGLKVDSEPEFVLNIEENKAVTAGSSGNIVLSISNTGPSDIKFVSIIVQDGQGYEVIGPSMKYLGNLQSDDFETEQYSLRIASDAKDEVKLSVNVVFKDAYNRAYERTEQLPMKIYSKSEATQLGLLPAKSSVGIIILVVVVLGIAAFVIFRRRSKRR